MRLLFINLIGMVNEDIENDPNGPDNDIERRKPKPFRYISQLEEVTEENIDQPITHSVMTNEQLTSEKLRENFESTLGIGDISTIEHVVKKHEKKRAKEKTIDVV